MRSVDREDEILLHENPVLNAIVLHIPPLPSTSQFPATPLGRTIRTYVRFTIKHRLGGSDNTEGSVTINVDFSTNLMVSPILRLLCQKGCFSFLSP